MFEPQLTDVVSHWYHLFEGLEQSTKDFYARLEAALKARNIPNTRCDRIELKEGGLFSAKRLYFRVWRKEHFFDVCAAQFGNAFFVSWWLSAIPSGCLSVLAGIPVINIITWWLARPITYYKVDTALMFQQAVHLAVLEVIEQATQAKGLRALSEGERKPIMRDFLQR